MAEMPEEEPTVADEKVADKYRRAGKIADRVLYQVVMECVDGALVVNLCKMGDQLMLDETKKEYMNIEKKGIAFHTCVSINNCVPINKCMCEFSPLRSDTAGTDPLKNGDLVKVELGVHFDGFIAAVGHTLVVGSSKEAKVTGRQADVIQAAYFASEIAHKMVEQQEENLVVTDAIQRVANSFNCNPVEGMMSWQLKKNGREQTSEFELHEAYVMDILISTGEGKASQKEPNVNVLYEKDGELVAQFKFTVLIMPNGTHRITSGGLFDQKVVSSSLELEDPELLDILQSSTPRKNKKRRKGHSSPHKNKKRAKATLASSTIHQNVMKGSGRKRISAGSGKLTEDDLSTLMEMGEGR